MNRIKADSVIMGTIVATILSCIVAILARPSAEVTTQSVPNLIVNDDFELGLGGSCYYWIDGAGPFTDCATEQKVALDWTAWWRQGYECGEAPGYKTGRPEYKLADDPVRVSTGQYSQQWFNSWLCLNGGLFQKPNVLPGLYYRASVDVQGSHTYCSSRRLDPPLEADCITPLANGGAWMRIGIDPYGSLEPDSPDIQWSLWTVSYGEFATIYSPSVLVLVNQPTVWIETLTEIPAKHNDAWADNVRLNAVHLVFLPVVK